MCSALQCGCSLRRFALQLASERLAYLLDHVVAGRPLLPGAAMFEAAAAAGRTLASTADGVPSPAMGGSGAAAMELCLTSVAIPAPVLLGTAPDQALLEVVVDCRGDAVQLARLPNASVGGGEIAHYIYIAHAPAENNTYTRKQAASLLKACCAVQAGKYASKRRMHVHWRTRLIRQLQLQEAASLWLQLTHKSPLQQQLCCMRLMPLHTGTRTPA